jgi:hypothetical protein
MKLLVRRVVSSKFTIFSCFSADVCSSLISASRFNFSRFSEIRDDSLRRSDLDSKERIMIEIVDADESVMINSNRYVILLTQ